MKIEGDKELIKALHDLPDKLVRKAFRKAANKAAAPVAKEQRKLVKPVSKTIAKYIGARVKLYPSSGRIFIAVGPLRDTPISPTGHRPSKTAHLVDRGTRPHPLKLYGKVRIIHPGARAHPFVDPPLESMEGKIQKAFEDELTKAIEQIGKK